MFNTPASLRWGHGRKIVYNLNQNIKHEAARWAKQSHVDQPELNPGQVTLAG